MPDEVYMVPQYYQYHPHSYYDLEADMQKHRLEQPKPGRKYWQERVKPDFNLELAIISTPLDILAQRLITAMDSDVVDVRTCIVSNYMYMYVVHAVQVMFSPCILRTAAYSMPI